MDQWAKESVALDVLDAQLDSAALKIQAFHRGCTSRKSTSTQQDGFARRCFLCHRPFTRDLKRQVYLDQDGTVELRKSDDYQLAYMYQDPGQCWRCFADVQRQRMKELACVKIQKRIRGLLGRKKFALQKATRMAQVAAISHGASSPPSSPTHPNANPLSPVRSPQKKRYIPPQKPSTLSVSAIFFSTEIAAVASRVLDEPEAASLVSADLANSNKSALGVSKGLRAFATATANKDIPEQANGRPRPTLCHPRQRFCDSQPPLEKVVDAACARLWDEQDAADQQGPGRLRKAVVSPHRGLGSRAVAEAGALLGTAGSPRATSPAFDTIGLTRFKFFESAQVLGGYADERAESGKAPDGSSAQLPSGFSRPATPPRARPATPPRARGTISRKGPRTFPGAGDNDIHFDLQAAQCGLSDEERLRSARDRRKIYSKSFGAAAGTCSFGFVDFTSSTEGHRSSNKEAYRNMLDPEEKALHAAEDFLGNVKDRLYRQLEDQQAAREQSRQRLAKSQKAISQRQPAMLAAVSKNAHRDLQSGPLQNTLHQYQSVKGKRKEMKDRDDRDRSVSPLNTPPQDQRSQEAKLATTLPSRKSTSVPGLLL
eukprot:NODE_353_length_2185_cov_182.234082_g281_i0.p1 GENE.NODE_353_length_2185_cov_182.234082_g281_i0~~NODE_353_length_2185_cov_182.234082_g281_i0.p1  ORF type:complete len:599 (-),score=54.06 NODE_353_length_2185_cov_182.234082_g281_i0:340-2136(-)